MSEQSPEVADKERAGQAQTNAPAPVAPVAPEARVQDESPAEEARKQEARHDVESAYTSKLENQPMPQVEKFGTVKSSPRNALVVKQTLEALASGSKEHAVVAPSDLASYAASYSPETEKRLALEERVALAIEQLPDLREVLKGLNQHKALSPEQRDALKVQKAAWETNALKIVHELQSEDVAKQFWAECFKGLKDNTLPPHAPEQVKAEVLGRLGLMNYYLSKRRSVWLTSPQDFTSKNVAFITYRPPERLVNGGTYPGTYEMHQLVTKIERLSGRDKRYNEYDRFASIVNDSVKVGFFKPGTVYVSDQGKGANWSLKRAQELARRLGFGFQGIRHCQIPVEIILKSRGARRAGWLVNERGYATTPLKTALERQRV